MRDLINAHGRDYAIQTMKNQWWGIPFLLLRPASPCRVPPAARARCFAKDSSPLALFLTDKQLTEGARDTCPTQEQLH